MRSTEIDGLREAIARLFPRGRMVACEPLGLDAAAGVSRKEAGYGQPLKVSVEEVGGTRRTLVFRTASSNEFGHDRRADRAAETILAFDTFNAIPGHVRAVDVGAIARDGLRSLRDAGELYLITTFAEGRLYADDLRAIAAAGSATARDLERSEALARWLVELHRERISDAVAWRRAVRDLLGSGEGIFGIVDAYPQEAPGASAARLEAIERRCLAWRPRLRGRPERLRRIHGDFHPFNLVFSEGVHFTALDASRGAKGDPADDVTALALNYVFFGLQAPSAWRHGFAPLWRRFWETYEVGSGDRALFETAAPYLAWRALVLGCPRFYPDLQPEARSALLTLAETALDAPAFDPGVAEALFS